MSSKYSVFSTKVCHLGQGEVIPEQFSYFLCCFLLLLGSIEGRIVSLANNRLALVSH